MPPESLLVVGVGDIHGRFHRWKAWLEALEAARGRAVDLVLAVGDVEAFRRADDHGARPPSAPCRPEFAEYADGLRQVRRPLYFIGGNNEDFEALHDSPEGLDLAPQVHYLGRAGLRDAEGAAGGLPLGHPRAALFRAAPQADPRRSTRRSRRATSGPRRWSVSRTCGTWTSSSRTSGARGLPQRARDEAIASPGRCRPTGLATR